MKDFAKLSSASNKILHNKYFAYLIYFLSAVSILNYAGRGQINAVALFSLTSILLYYFEQNLVVILLCSLLITYISMSQLYGFSLREGMENATDSTTTTTDTTTTDTTTTATTDDVDDDNGTLGKLDGEHNRIVNIAKRAKNGKEAKAIVDKLKESRPKPPPPPPTDESGDVVPLDSTTEEATATEAEATVSAMSNMAGGKQTKGGSKGPRIDYAATFTDAYSNLNKILGQKGIEGLTNETKQLMSQQQALMSQMEGMMPFVQNAQKMLQGLNVDGLLAGAGGGKK